MMHSIKDIAKRYEEISILRKDTDIFYAKDFFEFTKQNAKKYDVLENGDDLLCSSWYIDDLLRDFRTKLKNK